MTRRLAAEEGFTLVELLVAIVVMAIALLGVVNIFVSGTRAGADANARLAAQQNTRVALDRIEYEGRCAQSATLVGTGEGVAFSLPTWCSHASAQVTWCVVSGALMRYASGSCSGTGRSYVTGVTSATPFSLPLTPTGDLPQLDVTLTVNTGRDAGTASTLTDAIALRNAARAS